MPSTSLLSQGASSKKLTTPSITLTVPTPDSETPIFTADIEVHVAAESEEPEVGETSSLLREEDKEDKDIFWQRKTSVFSFGDLEIIDETEDGKGNTSEDEPGPSSRVPRIRRQPRQHSKAFEVVGLVTCDGQPSSPPPVRTRRQMWADKKGFSLDTSFAHVPERIEEVSIVYARIDLKSKRPT